MKRAQIDEMARTMEDLNAAKAVFFTTLGYQSGAESVAKHDGISIFTIRELNDKDWGEPGRIIDFYMQFFSRAITNCRFNAEAIMPIHPLATNIVIIPNGPTKTTHQLFYDNGEPGKKLEEVIDEAAKEGLSKFLNGKSFLINSGSDGISYLLLKNLTIRFEKQRRLSNAGTVLILKELIFDLGVRIDQLRFRRDRMDNFKYAVIIEDAISNKQFFGHRKKDEAHSAITEHSADTSSGEALKNGSVMQIFTTLWFDPNEMAALKERPIPSGIDEWIEQSKIKP